MDDDMNPDDHFDIVESFAEVEALLADSARDTATMLQLVEGLAQFDVHEDAPLRLEDAVCLPELGGSLTVDPALRSRSDSVTVKTLRGAIDRGEIAPGWKGKNMFVSRAMIREWLEKCQKQARNRTSSSGAPATRTAGSPTTRPGSSKRETNLQLALAAARKSMTKPS